MTLNYLSNWINANKISLNGKKTKIVIFKQKNKKPECPIKMKLSRKRLCPSISDKYFGVKTYENLNWEGQPHDTATRLNRENALLYKTRKLEIMQNLYWANP